MKTIGRKVHFLPTGEGNPRNGEGTFLRLKDGRILHAFTQYGGNDWVDHATASIAACCSSDEGESWSESFVLLQKAETDENIMSPSLIRMENGEMGMLYLQKEKQENGAITCMPVFRRSSDEGKSWSDAVVCGAPLGYYCAINDGILRQRNGRLLMPVSYHGFGWDGEKNTLVDPLPDGEEVRLLASEDDGRSWYMLPWHFRLPFESSVGLAEPGIYEREDGALWIWFRTTLGHQYESRSYDNGVTWSTVHPNVFFTSPDAPMRVKRIGGRAIAVWNPRGYNCLREDYTVRGSIWRTPLVCAVSEDDGHSFDPTRPGVFNKGLLDFTAQCRFLEDDFSERYCYPSIIETKDGFLVAYYHTNGSEYTLNATKITKVLWNEL